MRREERRRERKGRLSSELGRAAGWIVAPVFGIVSRARRARTFHPRGLTLHASVVEHVDLPAHLRPLAERLAGRALVRFSGALWKHGEALPDVLGCAIRLRRDDRETAEPSEDDQDILFATIRRPWTMPFAPLTTDVHDYLANDYFAVSPFDVGIASSVYLRLHPVCPPSDEGTHRRRADRLVRATDLGRAELELHVADEPFGPWTPLLLISLERVAHVDGEALRFRPFRQGRGVRPYGFVHALRVGVYALSQRARPEHASASSLR